MTSARTFVVRSRVAAVLIVMASAVICAAAGTASAAACPALRYHSAPTLRAQRACENLGVSTHGTEPGTYLFLTQSGDVGAGAGIFQDNGDLVWWLSTNSAKDHDMTLVKYQGQPYIALWTGKAPGAGSYGMGSITLYDQHYQVAGHISVSKAYGAQGIDLHEFQITPEGDALVGSYTPRWMRVHGHWEWVLGYLVEKWSLVHDASGIHAGRLLFAWNSLNDIRLSDSHAPDPGRRGLWDYFHGNGITQAPDGNLLVSARNTWGIYEINDRPGTRGFDHVAWQVGAVHDTRLAEPWCYQHNIAALGHAVYSLYDDGGGGPGCMPGSTQHPARGVIFSVDTSHRPVRVHLVRSYSHTPAVYSLVTGSMQILGNGDALVGWGDHPEITEFDPAGDAVNMDLTLSGKSYRGFRFTWDGQPSQPPALAAQRAGTGTTVWASWNGSTEVASWQVLGGPDAGHLTPVGGPVPKGGFETAISLGGQYGALAVEALSAQGAVLRTSNPIGG